MLIKNNHPVVISSVLGGYNAATDKGYKI